MHKQVKFIGVLWLGLAVGTSSLLAQMRVGAPVGNSEDTSNAPPPAGMNKQPTLLPVQTYAVIDLSAAGFPDFSSNSWRSIAMDDAHNIALGYTDNSGTATAITFSNGQFGPIVQSPPSATSDNTYYENGYYAPRVDGQWVGARAIHIVTDPNQPANTWYGGFEAYVLSGSSAVPFGLISPFKLVPHENGYVRINSFFTVYGSSRAVNAYYDAIDGVQDNSSSGQTGGYINILYGGPRTVCFCPDAPASIQNPPGTLLIRAAFAAAKVNDVGGALNGSNVWDGTQLISLGLGGPANPTYFDINNQNWVLLGNPETNEIAGALWRKGVRYPFVNLLAGTPWTKQLQQMQPLVFSNQNQVDGSMYVVTQALDNGVGEYVLMKGMPTGAAFQANGPEAPLAWQPYRMQLPDGVSVDWTSFEVISSSGVIAAIGNAGSGDNHALLLVPISLRLLNGFTSDFDGNVVTRNIPAPENPNHSFENSEIMKSSDVLGPKAPGSGRLSPAGCYYVTQVAAQAPALPWLHYKWLRRAFYLDWLITKQMSPALHWQVLWRNCSPSDDDQGIESENNQGTQNNIPSTGKHRFYDWDDSGIPYDFAGDVAGVVYDKTLGLLDFRYSEKVFSYRVLCSLDKPGWSEEDANWLPGVEMFASQKILLQEIKKTGIDSKDLKVLENVFYEGKINPRITPEKVRSIVGGSLPINIDPKAEYFNEVDPPDSSVIDASP